MERAIWAQGIRKKLEPGKKRHPYQASHSLRKWFKTRCEISGMKPINIETLLSHNIGISNSYYRPTENELLQDYLRSEDALTISHEKQLRHEVEKLKVENVDIDIIKESYSDMKLVVQSKNDEVSRLSDAVTLLSDRYNILLMEMERLKTAK
jgi:hypothetical protein